VKLQLEGTAVFGNKTLPGTSEDKDVFALVENGRSVVQWTRGESARARFTTATGPFPLAQRLFGEFKPGEEVAPSFKKWLESLEVKRTDRKWVGAAIKAFAIPIYRAKKPRASAVCKRGHPLRNNVTKRGQCKTCMREHYRLRRRGPGVRPRIEGFCLNGHPRNVDHRGRCLDCRKAAEDRRRERNNKFRAWRNK